MCEQTFLVGQSAAWGCQGSQCSSHNTCSVREGRGEATILVGCFLAYSNSPRNLGGSGSPQTVAVPYALRTAQCSG